MREIIIKHSRWLNLSIVSSIVSSLSLLAAGWVNAEGRMQTILTIFGLIFWMGLILEQIMFWQANRLLKEIEKQKRRRLSGRCGILSFATSFEGTVADVIFLISLSVVIVCAIFRIGESLMQYIFICLTVLSFRMHCFLNGKNYRYKKLLERKAE